MKLVTFLITTYNSEKWIKECINSVCYQSYPNLQILIIDDGSIDNTPKIISEIKDPRIDFYLKPHSGISKSLNFAMDKIKGDYVAKLGSDDFCHINRIKLQIKFMTKNPEYGIVGSNYYLFDSRINHVTKMRNPEKDEWIKEEMYRRCCVWDGSILMRTNLLFEANGYDENRYSTEDWEFFLRVLNNTKFYNIQKFLSSKRIHDNNISSTPSSIIEGKKIFLKFNNNLIEHSSISVKAQGFFNFGYFYYYNNNEIEKALPYFSKSFQLGGFNLRILKYYFFSKYLKKLVLVVRKYKIFRLYNCLRKFDKKNIFFRSNY